MLCSRERKKVEVTHAVVATQRRTVTWERVDDLLLLLAAAWEWRGDRSDSGDCAEGDECEVGAAYWSG